MENVTHRSMHHGKRCSLKECHKTGVTSASFRLGKRRVSHGIWVQLCSMYCAKQRGEILTLVHYKSSGKRTEGVSIVRRNKQTMRSVYLSPWSQCMIVSIFILISSLPSPASTRESCPLISPPSAFFPSITYNYSSPVTPDVFAALETSIASFLGQQVPPSYAVSVVHDGRMVFTSGLATTPFRIGSVSKVFTALGALVLRDKRLLSLDDPVKKFLPSFSIINPYEPHDITIRELMGHVSGLPRDLCATLDCAEDESKVLEALARMQVIQPPWSNEPAYSNLGFALLGRAWEKATSPPKSWEQFVMEDIVKPLGLNSTGVDITNITLAPNADPTARLDIGWLAPAGQMYSTATDLAKFMTFLLKASPPLVSAATLREWTKSALVFPDGNGGFALSWELLRVNFTSDFLITKNGYLGGYISIIAIHPQTQLGVSVLLASSTQDPTSLAEQILSILVPAVKASDQEIIKANYAGHYVCATTPPVSWPISNITIQVVEGVIDVSYSPATGLSAAVNASLLQNGQPILQYSEYALLLKDGRENSFWLGPVSSCLYFFGQISNGPSEDAPNEPGSAFAAEIVFDLRERSVKWPSVGAVCVAKH